jgi:hypothetical protein
LAPFFIGITDTELGRYEGIMASVERMGLREEDFIVVDDSRESFPEGFTQLVLVNPMRGVSEPAVRSKIAAWAGSGTAGQKPSVTGAPVTEAAVGCAAEKTSAVASPNGSALSKHAHAESKHAHVASKHAQVAEFWLSVFAPLETTSSAPRLRGC